MRCRVMCYAIVRWQRYRIKITSASLPPLRGDPVPLPEATEARTQTGGPECGSSTTGRSRCEANASKRARMSRNRRRWCCGAGSGSNSWWRRRCCHRIPCWVGAAVAFDGAEAARVLPEPRLATTGENWRTWRPRGVCRWFCVCRCSSSRSSTTRPHHRLFRGFCCCCCWFVCFRGEKKTSGLSFLA